jgi:hypothetical protein
MEAFATAEDGSGAGRPLHFVKRLLQRSFASERVEYVMKRLVVACAIAAALAAAVPQQKAFASDGVAVGILGGLAAGTILGAAMSQPRYYYEPVPVYVQPPPPSMMAGCYWTRTAPVWDEYQGTWIRQRIRVCE